MAEMSEAAKQARREYRRKWRAKNREHLRQYERDYWERKAAEMASDTDKQGAAQKET